MVFTSLILLAAAASAAATAKLSPAVLTHLDASLTVDVAITFNADVPNVIETTASLRSSDRSARALLVHQTLTQHAHALHAPLLQFLDQHPTKIDYKSIFINGKVYVRQATKALVDQLAARADVKAIDKQVVIPLPMVSTPRMDPSPFMWAIDRVEAPAVWDSGNRGAGVVVGSIDTGVRGTHEALKSNWRQDHGWFDAYNHSTTPVDYAGHGSHTMGTMVGTVQRIGVAPDAQWISCSAFDPIVGAPEPSLLSCAQFLLCPTDPQGNDPDCSKAPHVINNSWGGDVVSSFFDAAIAAWRAAGIIPVFSNGNDGAKGCGHAGYPATSPLVISVGSTDSSNKLSTFSSRGPTSDDRTKPDISAPGDFITSASGTQDDDYAIMGGTSMAAPHIVGTIALYLSANPGASFDDVFQALTTNTDAYDVVWPYNATCGNIPDTQYPNNGFGFGRLNVRKTVGATPQVPPVCSASYAGANYPGNDIASTEQANPYACCGDCQATTNCRAFVWTSDNGGTCWLKSAKGERVYTPFMFSGEMSDVPTTCGALDQDTDYRGFDIASTSQPSADKCCADCQATANCRVATWTDDNGGTCWLKSARGDPVSAPGAVSSQIQYEHCSNGNL
ncbi:Aste57867_2959 [Aphanomyces stellatus]|uniref:subtilisin n=1 Tax=Aphanomyces stellatus TaxID=120398 RepID=A0A485KCG2_9STRA|nr:hypothetical protein As57867_002950 [Aphanomyces stellatus]VFT80142.1 Aste57867_2959 [Aphanomyces stellatus]